MHTFSPQISSVYLAAVFHWSHIFASENTLDQLLRYPNIFSVFIGLLEGKTYVDNDMYNNCEHLFPAQEVNCPGWNCNSSKRQYSAPFHTLSLTTGERMWENKSAACDGLTTLLQIHLLNRPQGKCSSWKWWKGKDTLQWETNLDVTIWPSLSLSQVITFEVYTFQWQVVSSLWFAKPKLSSQGVSNLPWQEKLWNTSIFNSMPENRRV